ncbi:hypothetical protein GCM10009613_64700 [Pseudonocardia kongjuensis]|uniref:Ferredoxin n=1 Tax=Pseudonocardia kongjuensis TaxID=102227 RepID=A0ABP4J098_9PSEU
MPVVRADLDTCQGYANCVLAADDVFDVDDSGTVILLRAQFPDAERPRIEAAARTCPVAALVVEE